MGFFDKLQDVVKAAKKFENVMDTVKDIADGKDFQNLKDNFEHKNESSGEKLRLANSTHMFEETEYCDDAEYIVRYMIDDSFKEADSGAAEVWMLSTYSPDSEYGDACALPYVAIQNDDFAYTAVESFKEKGTFSGAIDLVPLSGKFYFKAKKEYGKNMAYFYGLDRCDGFWLNNGLCVVYPKSYVGTADETKLIQMLDVVADSYVEIKK